MGRPALTYEKRKLIAEMYQRPMSFRQICDEVGCSFYSAKKAVLEFNIEIRPKHVVLNNPMLGADNSGANNGMWKGGPPPCSDCGGDKANRRSDICFKCYCKRRRAADSFEDTSRAWRGRLEYTQWRNQVFQRDGYQCVACGINDHDLHAHHLEGFTANKELRFDPDNGVTLCQSHHKQFHVTYGYGGNTKQQFDEWTADLSLVAA